MSVYNIGAPVYRAAGWLGVVVLPASKKMPPPRGYTGWLGEWPTDEQIEVWRASRPDGNLLLRLPDDMLALDVDSYDDKTGGLTLKEAESRWGPLPPTYRNSARPWSTRSAGTCSTEYPRGSARSGCFASPSRRSATWRRVQHHHRFVVGLAVGAPQRPAGSIGGTDPDGEILPPEGEVPSTRGPARASPRRWLDGLAMNPAEQAPVHPAPVRSPTSGSCRSTTCCGR